MGEDLARLIASKDRAGLVDLLAPDIDFRAMTLLSAETEIVVDRGRVGYTLRVRNPDGLFNVQQKAYFESRGEQISWLRIVCAGYRPVGGE